jgi:hypothetical protein
MKLVFLFSLHIVFACNETAWLPVDAALLGNDGAPVSFDARSSAMDAGSGPIGSTPCELVVTRTRHDNTGNVASIARVYIAVINPEHASSAIQVCYPMAYGYPGGGCQADEDRCSEEGEPVNAICAILFPNKAEDGRFFVSCGQETAADFDDDGILDPFTGFVAESVTVLP